MAKVIIAASGISTIYREAERAILEASVSVENATQRKATSQAASTSQTISNELKSLAAKDTSGEPAPDAPVTWWSASSMHSYSYRPWNSSKREHNATKYRVSFTYKIKFRDFAKLGEVATALSAMPFLTINGVSWDLTKITRDSLQAQSRQEAVQAARRKAEDYASALGLGPLDVRPLEVADPNVGGLSDSGGGAEAAQSFNAPGGAMSRSFRGGGHDEPGLDFKPEDVAIHSEVHIRFEASPS